MQDLICSYQRVLSRLGGLDLIPSEWLHLTMQGVGFTDEVSSGDLSKIVDSAVRRLETIPPACLTFGPATIRTEAIVLPPTPAGDVRAIRTQIRAAIGDVWGHDSIPEPADRYEPHLSLAYVNTPQQSQPIADALARVAVEAVTVTIDTAPLIVLRRDEHLYCWETFATVPLRGS
ncbi:MAG: 2'-5' RNA ligase family protein [Streptosporangiaceae bacterium]